MNFDQLSEVLKMVAAGDRRTIGEADFALWGAVLADVSFADAAAAIVEHHSKSTEYLMPVHVKTIAKRLVKERFENTPEPIPPAEIVDNPAAYLAWKRDTNAAIRADTYTPLPQNELPQRNMRAIRNVFQDAKEATKEATPEEPHDNTSHKEAAA